MRLAPIALASALLGSSAFAASDQSFVALALTRTEDHAVAEGDESSDEVTIINATLGFGMGSGLVLGAKYYDYSNDSEFLTDDSTVIQGFGPLIGYYHQSGFFGAASYLYKPTKTYKTDNGNVRYEGGSGYVLEAGKSFPVSSSFAFAVELVQAKTSYEKVKGAGADDDLDKEWSDTSLYPYVALFVYF